MTRSLSARAAAGALLLASIAVDAHAQVVFHVDFDTTAASLSPDERAKVTSHVQAAGLRWVEAMDVDGPRSLDVRIFLSAAPTANARSTAAAFVRRIEGRDTFEQGAAHELRTGVDPNGTAHDIEITFGTQYLRDQLWFDPAPLSRMAPVPADRVDAMSVVLHELGHAFAYNGWAAGANATPPGSYWSTFDSWIAEGNDTLLPVFAGPQAIEAWGSAPDVTRNNVHHWGNAANGGRAATQPPIAPVIWRNGAPQPQAACGLVHTPAAPPTGTRADTAERGATLIDELMNGIVFYTGTRYAISELDRAVLRDIGLASDDRLFASGFEALP